MRGQIRNLKVSSLFFFFFCVCVCFVFFMFEKKKTTTMCLDDESLIGFANIKKVYL